MDIGNMHRKYGVLEICTQTDRHTNYNGPLLCSLLGTVVTAEPVSISISHMLHTFYMTVCIMMVDIVLWPRVTKSSADARDSTTRELLDATKVQN